MRWRSPLAAASDLEWTCRFSPDARASGCSLRCPRPRHGGRTGEHRGRRTRLIGVAGVSTNLVKTMELQMKLPARMKAAEIDIHLAKIATGTFNRALFVCEDFAGQSDHPSNALVGRHRDLGGYPGYPHPRT